MAETNGRSAKPKQFTIFNQPAFDWLAYEVLVGLIALLYLGSRLSYAGYGQWMLVLRHFPIQELPALAGALALSQAPRYLKDGTWILGVLLTASGATSLDMGVILRVANDQHGHLGAWQLYLGYGAAIVATALAAICVDASGSLEEQREFQEMAVERLKKYKLLGR